MNAETEEPRTTVAACGTWREALDLEGRMDRNPYGMLAGALGVGFVLGGGLRTSFTARLVGAGLRMGMVAAWPIVQEKLLRAALGSTSQEQRETDQ